MYPLPKVTAIGNVMSVKKEGNTISVKASSNYLKNDSITIRASCRGVVCHDIQGLLENGSLEFSLSASDFPEGIIAFTMIDHSQPVAERLYFNERPESRINISISPDKTILHTAGTFNPEY